MKTFAKIVAGVFIVEMILAVYKVPIADTTLIVVCAAFTGCLLLGMIFIAFFAQYANAQGARLERMYNVAQEDRAIERNQYAEIAHHALETAQVSMQAAAIINQRLEEGVRLYLDGNRYVLDIPNYGTIDAIEEAKMDTAMIDYMAQEQLPLLESGK